MKEAVEGGGGGGGEGFGSAARRRRREAAASTMPELTRDRIRRSVSEWEETLATMAAVVVVVRVRRRGTGIRVLGGKRGRVNFGVGFYSRVQRCEFGSVRPGPDRFERIFE